MENILTNLKIINPKNPNTVEGYLHLKATLPHKGRSENVVNTSGPLRCGRVGGGEGRSEINMLSDLAPSWRISALKVYLNQAVKT